MPEQIIKWITKDGYEYDTERQAILHEQYREELEEIARTICLKCKDYIDIETALTVAEALIENYTLEKK